MFATVRRYEGVDQKRTEEVTDKIGETLIPLLSKLPGFSGYYLVEPTAGVMASISLFDTAPHANDSSRAAAAARVVALSRARAGSGAA
jgi:hypothetical protein